MKRLFILAGLALLSLREIAWGQAVPTEIFSVKSPTYGCVNPRAARDLNNLRNPRRANARWVNALINNGHCVYVTPASRWQLQSVQGDLALMLFAGGPSSGAETEFYILRTALADQNGHIPYGAPPSGITTANPDYGSGLGRSSAPPVGSPPPQSGIEMLFRSFAPAIQSEMQQEVQRGGITELGASYCQKHEDWFPGISNNNPIYRTLDKCRADEDRVAPPD